MPDSEQILAYARNPGIVPDSRTTRARTATMASRIECERRRHRPRHADLHTVVGSAFRFGEHVPAYSASEKLICVAGTTFGVWMANRTWLARLIQSFPNVAGIAALREFYGQLFKRVRAGFQSEYLDELVSGAIVVVNERTVGTASGKSPSGIAMFQVHQGKIDRMWFGPFR